jgi:O-antigen/teichoic acid export membrane protein
MNSKIKNFIYALSANLINFILGIITGFLVPKFLGVDNYGYFKIFTFYVTYVGFMHFGLLDGIYVKYGSYDYEQIPKEKFRGYFKFLVIQQIILCVIIIIGLMLYPIALDRKIIYLFVILNMIILNLTTFFTFICQFTKRFKIFSINTVLTKLSFSIGCVILFFINQYTYMPYIIIQTLCNLSVLIIYIVYDKELVFGKTVSIKKILPEIKIDFKTGFFVMIGNFMSLIISGIDRIFIDKFFTLNDFAYFSFAYSLVSLFYILLNSVSSVIYPYLSRLNENNLSSAYVKIKRIIALLIGMTLSAYFIIEIIVRKFLIEYIPALDIFIYLVPTVLLSGQISILIANYFRILKVTKEYTKNNIVAVILSFLSNLIGYLIFKNTTAIVVATLISFMLWVYYSDRFFEKKLSINLRKAQIMELIIIILFLACALFFSGYIGMLIYIILYAVIIILNKDVLKEMLYIVRYKEASK